MMNPKSLFEHDTSDNKPADFRLFHASKACAGIVMNRVMTSPIFTCFQTA